MGIYTMSADGSNLVMVVSRSDSDSFSNYLAAWSPDGEQIAFDAASAVMRSAADGSTTAANLTGGRYANARKICWRPAQP